MVSNVTENSCNADGQEIPLFEREDGDSLFPVVAIGASAGGLQALEELFRNLSSTTGMAFVVVSHQSPGHTSRLPELLGKIAVMKPVLAEDGMKIEPNAIYISPSEHNIIISNGMLKLVELAPRGAGNLPIDLFFRSLAAERKQRAVGIILSGTGTDGTVGLRAIKAESGLAIVQEPSSAEYDGMPKSAIATQIVDYVLPPGNMAEVLASYAERIAQGSLGDASATTEEISKELVDDILNWLREKSGHDFSSYKRNMVSRRLMRRMVVNQLSTPVEYFRFLKSHPRETGLLMKALLISVTDFFRDPEAFEVFAAALPALLSAKAPGSVVRAWVPGCATGEEVYTLSILLAEKLKESGRELDIQIFGTDLDSDAIDIARRGHYPVGIAIDVTAPRLQKFFVPTQEGYQVRKEIRDKVIFAVQDLIKDPPFTKLDIVICRNLLIYLEKALQRRVLSMFDYAMNTGALLFLGSSESVSGFDEQFGVVDKRWKIYSRKQGPRNNSFPAYPFTAVASTPRIGQGAPKVSLDEAREHGGIVVLAEKLLARRFAPFSVIINSNGDVLFIHGNASEYLVPVAGAQPNFNIVSMAREGLALPLAAVLRRASLGEEITMEGLYVASGGENVPVYIQGMKIAEPEMLRGLILVTFQSSVLGDTEEKQQRNVVASINGYPKSDGMSAMLDVERELHHTRESLQDAIEELQSSNEELQSSNEELQSTNEELETSREELQSLNEELHAVNAELETKIQQLSSAKDDMQNLLDGIDVATIFLDRELRI